jgi:hypothetical protein
MDNVEVQANEDAAHCQHLLFYMLEMQKKIVQEAFFQPNFICRTAHKWRVPPNQISKGRLNIMADEWLPAYPYPCTIEEWNCIYLLQDQFSVHMNAENNAAALQTAGVEVDFILAGYTPTLQVMDKGLHKPFKQYLRELSVA